MKAAPYPLRISKVFTLTYGPIPYYFVFQGMPSLPCLSSPSALTTFFLRLSMASVVVQNSAVFSSWARFMASQYLTVADSRRDLVTVPSSVVS